MRVGDVEVHVEGDGAPIVMLHGWPDTHGLWDAQVAALRAHYRCIRFTLPGFAPGAPKQLHSLDAVLDTLAQVVEQVAGGPVTMLLHDWGCFFGYQFALRHPQWVARVIAVDVGDAGSRHHRASLNAAQMAMIAGYQGWLAAAWKLGGATGDRMARSMARRARAPADSTAIHAQMGWPYWRAWTGGFRAARTFTPHCPMLFVYGARKPFMFHSPEWAADLAAKAGCAVQAFDTGHWVMTAARGEFNQAVLDWLQPPSPR